jgi:subtilisin family serine protease
MAALMAGLTLPASLAFSSEPGGIVPGQLLVEFRSGKDSRTVHSEMQRTANRLGGRIRQTLSRGQVALLELAPGDHPAAAAGRALQDPTVVAAAPNTIRRLAALPNDPLFSPNQWALHNTGQTVVFPDPSDTSQNITLTGLADADIDAPEAWDTVTGNSSVVVAVIDSGFPTANADLTPNLWINSDEVAGDSIDNDGNGYIDDRNGYNFIDNTPNITDNLGHGSFCSGIIGARGNNGTGIAGINWQVSIMALKPFTDSGTATDADLIESIDYAVANGARIINASWGDWLFSPVLRNSIRNAGNSGVLFVAAAGNDRTYLKDQPFYPATFSLPNLINVGASDIRDRWADFSNYDNTLVDIHAPGYWVYSARPTLFEFGSGTSFATPQVAGVAALLLAQNPSLTLPQLRARVIAAFERRGTLDGRGATNGRLSAQRAVTAHLTDSTPPAAITNLSILETASNGFRLRFTAPGDDNGSGAAAFYEARVSTAPITATNFTDAARVFHLPAPSSGGTVESFYATELLPSTTYFLRVRATDDAGNVTALSNEVSGATAGRTLFFQDNMESGPGLWTAVAPFALTSEQANSGNFSWHDSPGGDYVANRNINITTANTINLSTATDPWLSFAHRYMVDTSFTAAGDNGEVQVTTDSINYRTVAQFVNFHTPFRLQRVNLKEFAGQPAVRIRFRFRSDFSARVADGWYIDDVEVYQPASLLPEPADFAVESTTRYTTVASAPGYTETAGGGSWFTSVSKATLAQLRTARSRYNVTTTLGSTARFTPQFALDGNYQVFVAWGDNANANNVRHRVFHADGSADVFLNQDSRFNAHQWISLGTFRFVRGQNANVGSVLVDDSTVSGLPNGSAEGRVYADGVRFLFQGSPANAEIPGWELYE